MKKDTIIQATKDSLSLAAEEKQLVNDLKPETMKDGITSVVNDASVYMEKFIAMLIDAIPEVVKAILFLIVGLFIIRTVLKIVKNRFEKRNVDVSLRGFLLSIIKFILYALLFLSVAANLGFQTTAILGALSGLVLAVGLALQGSLSNFAGGVLILLFRPFEVGDYIENSAGTDGTVDKIDLLYTTLTTAQGIKVFSPNGALANSVIRNFSKITNRRFEYLVGISYEDNIQTAQRVILDILNNDPRVIKEPAPDVFVSELADSSVNLTIRAWASKDDYWAARNSLQQEIKVALDKAGINIPFPQQEMRIIGEKPEIK
ncbi:mechanosensitive ion channel family protein [Flavobacterium sp. CBA20B-1]|uniref:mechanosensitive ion channel family protein n=1 Tax=unclassified Flavobacterium TaxID=196869 RepID=UPI002224CEA1|nr:MULTISPECIES: mechanosensitive ion channel family protein [unclassified Flavobacterium]WCM43443.1 mechanosensitive ion channel family protein [Flavobacterium sp. CBA20B-1]